jgi:hypothetical protein
MAASCFDRWSQHVALVAVKHFITPTGVTDRCHGVGTRQPYFCAAPDNSYRFSDYVQLPELGKQPDDQSVLQYVLGREDAAMKQYRDLAESAEPGPARAGENILSNGIQRRAGRGVVLQMVLYRLCFRSGQA